MSTTRHPAHKSAKHSGRMPKSISTQGRIRPKRVTAKYLRRLIEESNRRYHEAMRVVATDEQIGRYGQAMALVEEEIERYKKQGVSGE